MDPDKKKRLERTFGRKLTDGEAAEIEHTQVLVHGGQNVLGDGDMEAGADEPAVEGQAGAGRAGGTGLFHMGNRAIRHPT